MGITLLLIFTHACFASSLCEESGVCGKLIGKRRIEDSIKNVAPAIEKKNPKAALKNKSLVLAADGNLPSYYEGGFAPSKEGQNVLLPERQLGPKLNDLHVGDILFAKVSQAVKATTTTPSPVRAIIEGGSFSGSVLIGKATLEKSLKRVLIEFSKLKVSTSDQVYNFTATAQGPSGEEGLEGEYHTEEGKFLLYDALSATTASLMDSTVQRNQNILGGTEQPAPTMSNNVRLGATSGLAEVTARMADKAKNPPEFTELKGHAMIQVLVTDYAREEINQ